MVEKDLKSGAEIKNIPGSFVIEFSGTPFFQRFDKIVDPLGDLLSTSYDVQFKGPLHRLTGDTSVFETSKDILAVSRRAIDNIDIIQNNGHNNLLTGGIFEEISYINYYEEIGIISSSTASAYTTVLLEHATETDLVICILLSPQTALSVKPTAKFEDMDQHISRLMNHAALDKLNMSFIKTYRNFSEHFRKISLVDHRQNRLSINDPTLCKSLFTDIYKALSKIYPIHPNIFAYCKQPTRNPRETLFGKKSN
jgi:hypothetical protein